MKRCCFVNHSTGDVRVAKEALALVAEGYEVDIIWLNEGDEKKHEVIEGINIYRLSVNRKREGVSRYLFEYMAFFCLATIKLYSLYLKRRYDFIQVNTFPDFLVFVALVPKIFGAKVILDLHEPAPELFSILFGEDKKIFISLIKFFEQLSIRFADRAITVSKQMKKNYVNRGASASKIDIILNVPKFDFNPDLYENQSREENRQFILICHGAMLERYGQDVAIRAIEIVQNEIPDIELNILGYGEGEPKLKDLTSKLNLNGHVRFHGFLPYEDMIKMIASSDVGIVPMRQNAYSDLIHTNKMFDYIAMRKPVIISRTKAVEDFFGPDDSCLKYFKSGDEKDLSRCMIELYHDPDRRKSMVVNALKKYESVRWEITKHDYCRIYETLSQT